MWNTVLAINSFGIMPAAGIFLVYSAGHDIFFWQWRLFVIALVLFVIALIAEVVFAILAE
jgi:hypothetical protein